MKKDPASLYKITYAEQGAKNGKWLNYTKKEILLR